MNPAPTVNEGLLKNFEDGYVAFSKVSLRRNKFFHHMANPMRKDTVSYREWQRGWEAAYFENLEKLNGPSTRS